MAYVAASTIKSDAATVALAFAPLGNLIVPEFQDTAAAFAATEATTATASIISFFIVFSLCCICTAHYAPHKNLLERRGDCDCSLRLAAITRHAECLTGDYYTRVLIVSGSIIRREVPTRSANRIIARRPVDVS